MDELKTYYRYEPKLGRNDVFIVKEKKLCKPQRNCFETKIEAKNHFETAEKAAIEKYNIIMDAILELKTRYGPFAIEAYATCDDDSGLDFGPTFTINVDGYKFTFRQDYYI